jgi:hypothetical protein
MKCGGGRKRAKFGIEDKTRGEKKSGRDLRVARSELQPLGSVIRFESFERFECVTEEKKWSR